MVPIEQRELLEQRSAGVLLNISSLPGPYGVGGFGVEAREFVDRLAAMGFSRWQVLPLGPLDAAGSPYAGDSAFAGNYLYIDPGLLLRQGLVTQEEEAICRYGGSPYTADYAFARRTRMQLLHRAYERSGAALRREAETFAAGRDWLTAYCLYRAIKERQDGRPWWEWPEDRRYYKDAQALMEEPDIRYRAEFWRFVQYLFFRQWEELHGYVRERGVAVIGDMPIYLSLDSADVWSRPELFQLDPETRRPCRVAGVPPDYFSAEGQLWGNPLYNWEAMERDGYAWWVSRIREALSLYDIVRIDHFRAFASYWAVPAGAASAREGQWEPGPGAGLFRAVEAVCPHPAILAEDLGVFGEDVVRLLEETGFPGMRVIQFGFDPQGDSTHLPHHYPLNAVAYTGTHDNNTLLGWLWEASPQERAFALRYCGFTGENWGEGGYHSPSCRAVIETVWRSSARMAVIHFPDLCGFGSDARMNIPGVPQDNWRFRTTVETLDQIDGAYYREINCLYRRS